MAATVQINKQRTAAGYSVFAFPDPGVGSKVNVITLVVELSQLSLALPMFLISPKEDVGRWVISSARLPDLVLVKAAQFDNVLGFK
jgi:hypothetical protein